MNLFRWKRTLLRALGPALLCATLAAWGVYALTAEERPTYRSSALLNTGVMSNRDIGGAYNRDLVINELENIMNLARGFETREELAVQLLATFLAMDGPDPERLSARAYHDLDAELDEGIRQRHAHHRDVALIARSLITERDSLRRYGEATADHPLLSLLYGDNDLVGVEQLATLRVNRKGLSDLLEISYSTVDAAWCKLTLDRHIEIFLAGHRKVKDSKRSGALAYFQDATERSRANLNEAEERLRRFSTRNKVINYYEQTRFISSLKNQVDHRYTEEKMKQAAADSTLRVLEEKLAKRTDLIRLNNLVDDKRRELGLLSREQVRIEIMTADSSDTKAQELATLEDRATRLRESLTQEVQQLQIVHAGPEGLELGRLIGEWLAASLQVEESSGRLTVLDTRKIDFNRIYTRMADLGATIKKIEREVHIAEEDYLENLRNLNQALQKEHSQTATTDLRLVDAPILPSKPERSKRLLFVAVAFIMGFAFPVVMAIALELLGSGLLSFAEAELRTGLTVVGGVARWSVLQRVLRKRSGPALQATTADLIWQGLASRRDAACAKTRGFHLAISSLRPATGKTYVADLLAKRLAARSLRVALVSDQALVRQPQGYDAFRIDGLQALNGQLTCQALFEAAGGSWPDYDVVLWELPGLATGRLPVALAREAEQAILVHPASAGWSSAEEAAVQQLAAALGRPPLVVLNGLAVDVLLHEWGVSLRQLRIWADNLASSVPSTEESGNLTLQAEVNDSHPSLEEQALAHSVPPVTETAAVETASRSWEQQLSQAPFEQSTQPSFNPFALPEEPTTPAPFPGSEVENAANTQDSSLEDWESALRESI